MPAIPAVKSSSGVESLDRDMCRPLPMMPTDGSSRAARAMSSTASAATLATPAAPPQPGPSVHPRRDRASNRRYPHRPRRRPRIRSDGNSRGRRPQAVPADLLLVDVSRKWQSGKMSGADELGGRRAWGDGTWTAHVATPFLSTRNEKSDDGCRPFSQALLRRVLHNVSPTVLERSRNPPVPCLANYLAKHHSPPSRLCPDKIIG